MDEEPNLTQAHWLNDTGVEKWKSGHNLVAISMLRRAVILSPHDDRIITSLAVALWGNGEYFEAGALLRMALRMQPDNEKYNGNLGNFLAATGSYDEADKYLRRTIEVAEDKSNAIWDHGLMQLERGDWAEGFVGYEARIKRIGPPWYPDFDAPLWHGEDLAHKVLYVRGEQGFGDRINFSRYIAEVKRGWPTCRIKGTMFEDSLFWNYSNLMSMQPPDVPPPTDADYCVFICSLPGIMGASPTNIIPDPGFIQHRIHRRAIEAPARIPLPGLPSLKVGFVWTGNPVQTRNNERSVPLHLLLPLMEDPRIAAYSFQCGAGMEDLRMLGATGLIHDLGEALMREGWVSTALTLKQMDVLVTMDTGIAHLAGVLGVPTITMLAWRCCWRYMQTGKTTPWYPTMRLVRQSSLGDWSSVVDEVQHMLTEMADARLGSLFLKEKVYGRRSVEYLPRSDFDVDTPAG